MKAHMILASGSEIRARLLQNTGVDALQIKPRVDEDSVKTSLLSECVSPRDIADALAEMKAQKVSNVNPEALVLGSDQVLDLDGELLSKPATPEDCASQLRRMSGKKHFLHTAAVICEAGKPVWRHVGKVTVTVRSLSDRYIDSYVAANWESVRHSVGGYKLEEQGPRLLSHVQGDYFHVLGLPLLEIIGYLSSRGVVEV